MQNTTARNWLQHTSTEFNNFCKLRFQDLLETLLSRDARARLCHSVLSVCPSVTFRYRDHIGWNSSKIISRPNSLRLLRGLTPTWLIWCNRNTPKIRVEMGWCHSEAQKTCNISERVQDRTKVTMTDL